MTASIDKTFETSTSYRRGIDSDATTVCEAVGVFHDVKALESAIDELLMEGFDRATLSLIVSERAIDDKLRHRYERAVSETDRLDDVSAPRMAYVDRDSVTEGKAALAGGLGYLGATVAAGAVVFSGGAAGLAVLAAVAAGSGGAVIGTLLGRFIGRNYAEQLEGALERGGILLWVACPEKDEQEKAMFILRKHGASDVHVHELPSPDPALFTPGGVSYDLSFMNRIGL